VIRSDREKNVLIECMSNLVANEMFFDSLVVTKEETVEKVIDQVSVLSKNTDNMVIVTNNIFEDGREYDKYTTDYLDALSLINQKLIEMSDEAYEVVVGIPVKIKKVNG
jgi:adenosylcobinamide kinase/adenosylcobinamide-phosphate guanylyltransferase